MTSHTTGESSVSKCNAFDTGRLKIVSGYAVIQALFAPHLS